MLLKVKRKTRLEKRYSSTMGELITPVVYVKYYLAGLPLVTLHRYRETYYGEVKDCEDCDLLA